MKCNQPCPGFELVSPCPFPMTITITPRAPPNTPRAPLTITSRGNPLRMESDSKRQHSLPWDPIVSSSSKTLTAFVSLHVLLVHRTTICTYFIFSGTSVYSFEYLYLYIVFIKCFCMCEWVCLVFPSVYSVLVYHGYSNANTGTLMNGYSTKYPPYYQVT